MFSGKGFGVVKIPRENSRNRISSTGRKGFSDRIGEINLNGEISAGDGVDEDSGDSEDSEESDEEDVEEKEGDRAVEVLLPFMEGSFISYPVSYCSTLTFFLVSYRIRSSSTKITTCSRWCFTFWWIR